MSYPQDPLDTIAMEWLTAEVNANMPMTIDEQIEFCKPHYERLRQESSDRFGETLKEVINCLVGVLPKISLETTPIGEMK